jgi:DNA polymerase-3 subunit delta'
MTVSREEDRATMGVDIIRELKESLWAVPNDLEFKSYIIEDADTMTVQAQNAFLLTLEQPPRFVSFFLICENARSLLETIRSRAPVLRTEPIPQDMIDEFICSDRLDKKLSDAAIALKRSEPESYGAILISADGSIGRAVELLSPRTRKPISDRRALAMTFIESLTINGKKDHPLSLFPKFSQKRDELSLQLEYISCALRDLILLKKSENAPLCFFSDREKALDLSGSFFERKLISIFDIVNEARDALSNNANVRLTMIELLSSI